MNTTTGTVHHFTALEAHTDETAAEVIRWVDSEAQEGVRGCHGKDYRFFRAAQWALQGKRCAWCERPVSFADAQADRLLTGAERRDSLCPTARGETDRTCEARCRCGYVPGAFVVSCEGCHQTDGGVRFALTVSELRDRLYALPTAERVLALGGQLRASKRAARAAGVAFDLEDEVTA